MKSFIDFSENLEDKKQQLMQNKSDAANGKERGTV